jgi:hypothetical protein
MASIENCNKLPEGISIYSIYSISIYFISFIYSYIPIYKPICHIILYKSLVIQYMTVSLPEGIPSYYIPLNPMGNSSDSDYYPIIPILSHYSSNIYI